MHYGQPGNVSIIILCLCTYSNKKLGTRKTFVSIWHIMYEDYDNKVCSCMHLKYL